MHNRAILCGNITIQTSSSVAPKVLLENISFALPSGHFAAIIGASGCGKSTLLRTLAGIIAPTSGKIVLLGYPLPDYKNQFPLALGYLPQVSQAHEDLSVMEILQFTCGLQLPASVD